MPNRLNANPPRTHGLGVRRDAEPQRFDTGPAAPRSPAGGWGPVGPSRVGIINTGEKRTAISNQLSKSFGHAKVVSHPPLPTFHVMQRGKEPAQMRVTDSKLTLTRGDTSVSVAVPKKATEANVLKAVAKLAEKLKAAELAAD